MKPGSRFTEHDTQVFYDEKDSLYRSFWDKNGKLHYGFFNEAPDVSTDLTEVFSAACSKWDEIMLETSMIDSSSKVLDLGCGNGTVSRWLTETTGCEVVGVDLSGVRIGNAVDSLTAAQRQKVRFVQGTILNLPFPPNTFTHVWSQATLYHVPDRTRAIQEAHRVLVDDGVFVFDDLVSPVPKVNEKAKQYVYDRLLFEPGFSHQSYREALRGNGFYVAEDICLDGHLKNTYTALVELTKENHADLSLAYHVMRDAITEKQIGWSFFSCRKIADLCTWIYRTDADAPLLEKYANWASSYDSDLAIPYGSCPRRAADVLSSSLTPGGLVLDAGCGTGLVAERLAELGHSDLYGVDISPDMIEVANRKGLYRELKLHDLHAEQSPYPPETFDGIISIGVFTFNHVQPTALRSLVRMLKPSGTLVLSVREDFREMHPSFDSEIQRLPLEPTHQERYMIFKSEVIFILSFRKTA
jgi:ubiquinone/menaquinone biosynthesis C-methylase UbiE